MTCPFLVVKKKNPIYSLVEEIRNRSKACSGSIVQNKMSWPRGKIFGHHRVMLLTGWLAIDGR